LGGANGGVDTAEIAVSADDLVGFRRYGTAGNYLKETRDFAAAVQMSAPTIPAKE